MPSSRFRHLPIVVAFFVVSAVAYVLSAAPTYVVAMRLEASTGVGFRPAWRVLYRPYFHVSRSTPLDEPLYEWTKLWGDRLDLILAIEEFRCLGSRPGTYSYRCGFE